jgi:hypothetical protein
MGWCFDKPVFIRLTTPVPSLKKGGEPEGYGCTDRKIGFGWDRVKTPSY